MASLVKWYCDCVTEEGEAFIGYSAYLRWGPLALPYVAILHKPSGLPTRQRAALRSGSASGHDGDELRWSSRRFGARGTWIRRLPAIDRVLLAVGDGVIRWRCHFPRAEAQVELGERRLAGRGYAEELIVTRMPWRMPFDELRWGRLLTPEDAVTWIDWRGGEARRWVFHNGVELPGSIIEEGRIRLAGDRGVVELSNEAVLREGPLWSAAPRWARAAVRRLPAGLGRSHEVKWLARGRLTEGARSSSGWAIHEVVRMR